MTDMDTKTQRRGERTGRQRWKQTKIEKEREVTKSNTKRQRKTSRRGFKEREKGTSWVVHWFRLPGSIPGQGTRSHMLPLKITHAATKAWYSQIGKLIFKGNYNRLRIKTKSEKEGGKTLGVAGIRGMVSEERAGRAGDTGQRRGQAQGLAKLPLLWASVFPPVQPI